MSVVDMAVIGRLGGRELAAAGLANAIFFGVSVFGLGLMLGLDPLISQAVGAGDEISARRILWQGVWLGLITSALLIGILLGGPLLLTAIRVKPVEASPTDTPAAARSPAWAAFRFSPRYLHRLFEEFDFTVGDWIRRRRLHAAKVELASRTSDGITVTEVAMRYGFSDASHFSHAFKEEFALSPRDFRQQAREAAGV